MLKVNTSILLSYEQTLHKEWKLDNINDIDEDLQFKQLWNHKTPSSIILMARMLDNITIFDEECVKYFNVLDECFKKQITNISPSSLGFNRTNLILINSAICSFIKAFHKNFQNYNEKHKSVTKWFPVFIQWVFKTWKNQFNNLIEDKELGILDSFFALLISFLEYYPTLLRSYQKNIEEYINQVFFTYISSPSLSSKSIKTVILLYCLLFRLAPTPESKYNYFITQILDTWVYTKEYFQPKDIKDAGYTTNETKKNNIWMSGLYSTFPKNDLSISIKTIDLLFSLQKTLFKVIPLYALVSVNFRDIIKHYTSIILELANIKSPSNNQNLFIAISGLSATNYEIFLTVYSNNILSMCSFYVKNYPRFISPFHVDLAMIATKSWFNNINTNNYLSYSSLLEYCIDIVSNLSMILPELVDEIIFKFTTSSFPSLYFEFLERNDTTIVQLDDTFFKWGNKKNKIANLNWINPHYKGNYKSYSYLNADEHKYLLLKFLEWLHTFVECTHISQVNNNKSIWSGWVEWVVIPGYAKYMFKIGNDVTDKILKLLEVCVFTPRRVNLNAGKVVKFIEGFYADKGKMKSICDNILGTMPKKSEGENRNDVIGVIYDNNIKIKEIIKEKYAVLKNDLFNFQNWNEDENNDNQVVEYLKKRGRVEDGGEIGEERMKKIKTEKGDDDRTYVYSDIIKNEKKEKHKEKERYSNAMEKENVSEEEDIDIPDIK